jgi:hypothetical protein
VNDAPANACQFCVIAPESVVTFCCHSPTVSTNAPAMTVPNDNATLRSADVRRRFDDAADHFDGAD